MNQDLKMSITRLRKIDQIIKEIYLQSQDDNILRIDNYKKSITQKINWYKNRFKYQIGINRSNNMNIYKDIRKSYLNNKL